MNLHAIICLLLLSGLPGFVHADKESGFTRVDAPKGAKVIKETPELKILDVRTPREFKRGHLKQAVQLNFYEKSFKEQLGKLDRTKPYLIYCAMGGRSMKVFNLMKSEKFKTVYHLDGGIKAWEASGRSVVQPASP